jgi:hypothetical protein
MERKQHTLARNAGINLQKEINFMSLDKSIQHGRERRKPYRGGKAVDSTCRNHGSCPWCAKARKIKKERQEPVKEGEGK